MSRRALAALAVLCAALAVAVVLDGRSRPRPAGLAHRLWPELRATRVELERPGRPPVILQREGAAWAVDGRPADDGAVAELLGTLELLSFHRRVPRDAGHGLASPRLTVRVAGKELRIGRTEPALGWAWASDGGPDDLLVDDWAARALDRDAADLRRRAPFGPDATRIRLSPGVTLDGRCVELAGGCAAADTRRRAALRERLEALSLTRFLDADPTGAPELEVTAGDGRLAIFGACPGAGDERAVTSSVGAGCLGAEDAAALAALPREPLAWVERRLTSLDPAAVDRVDAGDLHLQRRGGSWRSGEEEVSPEAVRDLVGAFASATGAPASSGPLAGRAVTLAAGGVSETLVLAGSLVQRRGEPVALAVDAAARAAFAIDPVTLADRQLFELDPYTITELRVDEPGAPPWISARGTTLESWPDPAAAIPLRDALATLSAAAVVAARAAPVHGLDPPRRRLTAVTAEGRHVVDLGAPAGDGCYARRGDRPLVYRLRARACAALAQPVRR